MMMKSSIKYSFVLSAALALSFCQGRQSSIFDPTQGQNAMSAQQYLNSTTERSLPESMRSQRYSLSYTTSQADDCINKATETQEVSLFCNQIINDYLTKTMGVNYQNYAPENIQITAPNGKMFDYNTSEMLSSQNASWLPQYQQYIGGTDPNSATYFRTPYNMQNLCGGNATNYTNVKVNCGKFNWGYGTIAVNGNTGLNYMNQGQFNRAAPIFQPGGTVQTLCTSRCKGNMYQSTFYRTNMAQKNAQLEKQVNDQWSQIKQTPKTYGAVDLKWRFRYSRRSSSSRREQHQPKFIRRSCKSICSGI